LEKSHFIIDKYYITKIIKETKIQNLLIF